MIKLLELLPDKELTLYHVTTSDVAKQISDSGFDPKSTIDYKYYSALGKEGIYFYDNIRSSQRYAYFLGSKKPNQSLSLITVKVPKNAVLKTNKLEDGVFVPNDRLNDVKIVSVKRISKISDMY